MSRVDILSVATTGDAISGSELQPSIDSLLAVSAGLDAQVAAARDGATVQALSKVQNDLHSQAMGLVNRQIDLLAGEARVTAEHINAAAKAARDTIAKVADIRKRLQTIGKLLDFFAVVLTGRGEAIVQAAFELKDGLDAAA